MSNKINDKIYVVYSQTKSSILDTLVEDVFHLEEYWFTNEDQAWLCADYLNMSDNYTGYFSVAEITNGDDIDYKALIEEEKRKQKTREALRAKEARFRDVDNYALYKSRVEGLNYYDALKELREKYADYVEGEE